MLVRTLGIAGEGSSQGGGALWEFLYFLVAAAGLPLLSGFSHDGEPGCPGYAAGSGRQRSEGPACEEMSRDGDSGEMTARIWSGLGLSKEGPLEGASEVAAHASEKEEETRRM